MRIDVCGGSGFIGTRLCGRLLSTGKYDVRIVDKRRSEQFPSICILGDVRNKDDFTAHIREGSILVNLAAEHRDDVRPASLYYDVNVGGAINVCAAARAKNVNTIVFTSSVAVYGFAPVGTDESGEILPFNDYGRTKFEAEQVYRDWHAEDASRRTLVIIRPTVVFGERNRGNVYNLLRLIASGNFAMIGNGENRKSMAYVDNVSAFIEYCISFGPGVHLYNFSDKPDLTMNALVCSVRKTLGKPATVRFRLPYAVGLIVGKCFDVLSFLSGRRFSISAIRVKKFCANSVYCTNIARTGFRAPVALENAVAQTVRYEFMERGSEDGVFVTE